MTEGERKLKVLFVTSDKYPPFRPAARVIFGDEMRRRGHVVDWLIQAERAQERYSVVTSENGIAHVAATDDGTARWRRIRKYLLDLRNDLRVFKLAACTRYDVIQVKDKFIAAIFAMLAAKRTGTPFAFWLAYPHPEASLYSAKLGTARYRWFRLIQGTVLRILLYKIILPAADHVFVQSEQMKQDIAAEGIPLEKMTAIPSSVNLSDIPHGGDVAGPCPFTTADEKRIVYLGTLMRIRRLDFVIRAFAMVKQAEPTARLYFVGKGEMPQDEKILREEAQIAGVANDVVFAGFHPMQEAWEYVRNADVCLSPYYPTPILNSTSPTKLIEYMAMGKPVVCNDHPEQSLIITQSRGGLSVPWNEKAFAEAVIKILHDPATARDMGQRGRKFVETHRTNTLMADTVIDTYYRISDPGADRSPAKRRLIT